MNWEDWLETRQREFEQKFGFPFVVDKRATRENWDKIYDYIPQYSHVVIRGSFEDLQNLFWKICFARGADPDLIRMHTVRYRQYREKAALREFCALFAAHPHWSQKHFQEITQKAPGVIEYYTKIYKKPSKQTTINEQV